MNQRCDFLVIGSGIAGLCFAIHAARYGSVIIITKKNRRNTNTNRAQGGIAAVMDAEDSYASHIQDTLIAGAGLCDQSAVEATVNDGPERIAELIRWGVKFSTAKGAKNPFKLDLGREGGHSLNRIVHAHDLTGHEVENTLLKQINSLDKITIYENDIAVDLITGHHLAAHAGSAHRGPDRCYGAYVFNTATAKVRAIQSKITCIATGGAGRVYLHTTNPEIATGDGIAMAYRAGATIANMEFIQFHPTALYHKDGNSFLISEALRGFGAILKNRKGVAFMDGYHPLGSLAPRDIVARAIDREIKNSGDPCVYLDIRHISARRVRQHFPHIYGRCKTLGIDITTNLIPVVPAAHYICGGIQVDLDGISSVPNLYACGEAACTGVHGANRLASNSLLEALVFARRAATSAALTVKKIRHVPAPTIPAWDDSGTIANEEWILLSHNLGEIRSVMWDYVGIVRSNVRLGRAYRRICLLEKEIENFYKRTKITPHLLELRNIVTTAKLIVVSAQKRRESRGLHFTTDHPKRDDRHWLHNTILRKYI